MRTTPSNVLPLFSLQMGLVWSSCTCQNGFNRGLYGSEDSVCVHVCICCCCGVAGADGSPGPGGTALVNNSDEAHYQGSTDLSLIPP